MTKLSAELLYAIVEIVAFAVGTGALSTLGIYIELLAMGAFSTGQLTFGLWLVSLGGVSLYFGLYAIGLTELLPRVRRLLVPPIE